MSLTLNGNYSNELDEYHIRQAKSLQERQPLYNDLARLFERCVPYMESVFGYAVSVRPFLRQDSSVVDADDEDYDEDYYQEDEGDDSKGANGNKNNNNSTGIRQMRPLLREIDQSVHLSFRGQWLQVVTQIVDYKLSSSLSDVDDDDDDDDDDNNNETNIYDDHNGWHVNGRPHEEIVLTCMYILDRDDDDDVDAENYNNNNNTTVEDQGKTTNGKASQRQEKQSSTSSSSLRGGDVLFKRAFHQDEANYVYSNRDLYHSAAMRNVAESWLMVPLGRVETLRGRLIVFPNSHIHKLDRMFIDNQIQQNVSMMKKGDDNENNNNNNQRKKGKKNSKCRMVIFHLVNPMRRIISTREILPQQSERQARLFGGTAASVGRDGGVGNDGGQGGQGQQPQYRQRTMDVPEALDHRLDLIQERKETRPDWNVHEVDIYN